MDTLFVPHFVGKDALRKAAHDSRTAFVGVEAFIFDASFALDLSYIPLLVATVHALFFILFIALSVRHQISSGNRHESGPPRKYLQCALGDLHGTAKWICIGLFFACGLVLLELIREAWQSSGARAAVFGVVLYATQSLAWLVISVALQREEAQDRSIYSHLLGAWWIAFLVLSILDLGAALVTGWSNSSLMLLVPFVFSLFLVIIRFAGYVYRVEGTADLDSKRTPLLKDRKGDLPNVSPTVPAVPLGTGFSHAGFLSVLTFSWLNPLLSAGNKKPLNPPDIPLLDPVDEATANFEAFQVSWERQRLETPQEVLPSIWMALWRTFWRPFIASLFMGILWSLVLFVGPILQNLIINFMEEEHRLFTTGAILVLTLLSGKIVEALSSHQLAFRSRKLGLRMWAGVGCAVYNKTLRLSLKARQVRSVGEITNLLSTDVQRLLEMTYWIQQGLALPAQVVIAVVILFQVVGVSMLSGLLVLSIVLISNVLIVRKMRGYRILQVLAKDKRMQATSECLGNMKVIKLQAWDEMFKQRIEQLRERERRWVQRFMYSLALTIFVIWSGPLAVSAATFLTMVLLGEPLTTARVFTALTTFRIIQEPIKSIPDIVAYVTQAAVSLNRIRSFLLESEVDENAVERVSGDDSPYAVELEVAAFTWDAEEAVPALKDLNLKVEKGACVAICGGVGSGKSSLLYAIMGELPRLSGTAKLSGRVAYVAQSAWIQNNSIQENILFGLAMDSKRYKEAVRVSGLETDLAQFPEGDQTEIGERGTNLSGGQKQRVQLARAVYQDADIYLLDDPFSAVDAHTGTFLFEECVRGALREKTVLLVTHQVEFLPAADLIIVMRAPGEIVQKGTYSELLREGRDFGSFVDALQESLHSVTQAARRHSEKELDTLLDSQLTTESGNMDVLKEQLSRQGSRTDSKRNVLIEQLSRQGSRADSLRKSGSTKASEIAEVRKSTKGKLIEEELRETGRVASDLWLAWGTSNGETTNLRFIEVYIFFVAFCSVSVLTRSTLVAFAGIATAQAFFQGMLNSIIRAPMSFIDSTPLGRIISRSSTDQTTLDMDLPNVVASTGNNAISTICSILITTYVTPQILLVVIPLAYFYIRLQFYYIASARELSRLTALTEAPVFLHVSESIAGATTIRAFREQNRFQNTNSEFFGAYQRAYFHNLTATEWLGLRLDFLGATVLSSAALLLVTLPEDTIAPGSAGMSLSYGLSLSTILMRLVSNASAVENKMVSVERINQYSDIPSEAPAVIPDRRPPSDWPNSGRIELQNFQAFSCLNELRKRSTTLAEALSKSFVELVEVRYRPGAPLVLKGVSCVIHPREKVGVVGRTGSGKSTLIQALFRLIEPAGGRILIDGLDISEIGLTDLRSKLGVIPQEPTLFEGTVRSNLDPFNLCSDEQLWEALDKCQLSQVLREKAQKLDALVTEQGENWSVGERQLLCLGRALLKRARILVLDEATASVDITTDAIIQNTIKHYFVDCTVISVAHRIPSVIDSDRVLVLDAGLLMENNSPEQLLLNEDSMFSKLVQEYTQRTGSDTSLDSYDP